MTGLQLHGSQPMNRFVRNRFHPVRNHQGFTLVELVLATLISTLVIGILSVSLGFSLRVWERQQNPKPRELSCLLNLMKWQLAQFDPEPIALGTESGPLFRGEKTSLAFATDYSVKALSKGVPVIARYVFVPSERALYYAEVPLHPNDADGIREFLEVRPGKHRGWPPFYAVPAAEFSLGYIEKDGTGDSAGSWEGEESVPAGVVVTWNDGTSAVPSVRLIVPNFLFHRKALSPLQPGGLGGSRSKGGKLQ